jgi:hypothetical protein
MGSKILVWVVVFFVCVELVFALGIRPANTKIVYDETPVYAGSFWVVNNDHQELDLVLSVEGSLAEFVTLKDKEMTLSKEDEFKNIYFDISLPDNLPAGESNTYIVVSQKLTSTEQGFIASKLVLKHKLAVEGPYPSKYVVAKVNFNVLPSSVEMISEVENVGKEDVGSVKTVFYVNDKAKNELDIETEEVALRTGENKLLRADVNKSLFDQGEFEVLAVTSYDNQKLELFKKMVIGRPEIDITYFDKYFIAGDLNKYSMDLQNEWNKEIENVYVDVSVKKGGSEVDSFRTRSVDLPGFASQRINDYFDARSKSTGVYSFDMVVNFWNTYKMETKTFRTELLTKDEFDEASSAGRVVVSGVDSGKFSLFGVSGFVLLIVALVIICANLVVIVLFLRRRKL